MAAESEKKKTVHFPVKRTLDVILSLMGGILSVPFVLLGSLAIVLEDPTAGPIFAQERVGKNGKHFVMFKLRSMRKNAEDELEALWQSNESDGPAFKIKNDPRITKVGRILRKTYIDELPQFFNVLRGDMSLVGPRPPLPAEVANYDDRQRERLSVEQGMTCFWQIAKDRYNLPFEDWVDLDLKYSREQSFLTDLKILAGTVATILRMSGW